MLNFASKQPNKAVMSELLTSPADGPVATDEPRPAHPGTRTAPPVSIPAPPVVSLVVPCFNESARIPELIKALRRWDPPFGHAEVIAVDDGSSDDTYSLLQQAAEDLAGHVDIRVERLEQNAGKGAAVRHGIAVAGGTYTVFLDADLSVGLDEIAPTISRLDQAGADIAFGSRHHPESVIPEAQPLRRQLGGRAINLAARALGLTSSRDTQCGFKVLRRDAASYLFPLVRDNGFAFDIELLYLAERLRYSVIEVPVTWSHRDGSTVSPVRDGLAILRTMVSIRRRWRQP